MKITMTDDEVRQCIFDYLDEKFGILPTDCQHILTPDGELLEGVEIYLKSFTFKKSIK